MNTSNGKKVFYVTVNLAMIIQCLSRNHVCFSNFT
jgi:hypothetical protein